MSAQPHLIEPGLKSLFQDDEPHTVGAPGTDFAPGAPALRSVIEALTGKVIAACSAFPVPGDVSSVPFLATTSAVEAEEVVLVRTAVPVVLNPDLPAGSLWALVPTVVEFGSPIERGYLVSWQVVGIEPWELQILGAAGSLADARVALRSGLIYATEALTSLDVAAWREEHRDMIELLADPVSLAGYIPPDLAGRHVEVLEQAARLRAIIDLARFDEGGSLNAWQADQRLAALKQIDAVARRAMTAATLFSGLVDH